MLFDAEAAHAKPPNAPPAGHPWPRDPGSCSSPCRLLGSWENLARCPRDFDNTTERPPDKHQRDIRGPCPLPCQKGQREEIPRWLAAPLPVLPVLQMSPL